MRPQSYVTREQLHRLVARRTTQVAVAHVRELMWLDVRGTDVFLASTDGAKSARVGECRVKSGKAEMSPRHLLLVEMLPDPYNRVSVVDYHMPGSVSGTIILEERQKKGLEILAAVRFTGALYARAVQGVKTFADVSCARQLMAPCLSTPGPPASRMYWHTEWSQVVPCVGLIFVDALEPYRLNDAIYWWKFPDEITATASLAISAGHDTTTLAVYHGSSAIPDVSVDASALLSGGDGGAASGTSAGVSLGGPRAMVGAVPAPLRFVRVEMKYHQHFGQWRVIRHGDGVSMTQPFMAAVAALLTNLGVDDILDILAPPPPSQRADCLAGVDVALRYHTHCMVSDVATRVAHISTAAAVDLIDWRQRTAGEGSRDAGAGAGAERGLDVASPKVKLAVIIPYRVARDGFASLDTCLSNLCGPHGVLSGAAGVAAGVAAWSVIVIEEQHVPAGCPPCSNGVLWNVGARIAHAEGFNVLVFQSAQYNNTTGDVATGWASWPYPDPRIACDATGLKSVAVATAQFLCVQGFASTCEDADAIVASIGAVRGGRATTDGRGFGSFAANVPKTVIGERFYGRHAARIVLVQM